MSKPHYPEVFISPEAEIMDLAYDSRQKETPWCSGMQPSVLGVHEGSPYIGPGK
jgi:hypothetical protein